MCDFFLKVSATTECYTYCHTRSLHDARPITRQRIDEPDPSRRLVDGETEHRSRLSLAVIAAAAPALLGRDIGALDARDIIAGIVAAPFHRTDQIGRAHV